MSDFKIMNQVEFIDHMKKKATGLGVSKQEAEEFANNIFKASNFNENISILDKLKKGKNSQIIDKKEYDSVMKYLNSLSREDDNELSFEEIRLARHFMNVNPVRVKQNIKQIHYGELPLKEI